MCRNTDVNLVFDEKKASSVSIPSTNFLLSFYIASKNKTSSVYPTHFRRHTMDWVIFGRKLEFWMRA